MDKEILKSLRETYFRIDDVVSELVKARLDEDEEKEGRALCRMEMEMVGVLQEISYILDRYKYGRIAQD